VETKHCNICYTTENIDDHNICDVCDCVYCNDCSYSFTIHYQYYGAKCYLCADQSRRIRLTVETKRDNKIKLITEN